MHNPYTTELYIPRPHFLGGNTWQLTNLQTITVLFGKNGSGKSKLLRQWRDNSRQTCHYVVPERAGEMDYQAGYIMQQMDANERASQTNRNYGGEYRRQVIARIQAYFAARGDHRGDTLPTNPDELEAMLSPLLPDFVIQLSGTKAPPYKLTRVATGEEAGNIDQLSSGETQILTLALDILTIIGIWELQHVDERIILIDEPDAHIHTDLQVRFADFLVQVTKRFKLQIVVATHSTTLLAAIGQFAKDSAGVLYLERDKPTFKAEPYTRVMREISSCLGGHALMGPLFGAPLLLVEGDDDYRIWSQVPRYHKVRLSAIPSEGDNIKKHQKSLEQIFGSLREAGAPLSGYALIDQDKGKPVPDAANPQNHIKYIQLECHESENLYITDEVLSSIGTTWEEASSLIVQKANEYGEKEAVLSTAKAWDRKTHDVKKLINEIAQIVDPKKIHWTLRVAKVLGSARPDGQIGDFLGEEVITSIWGALAPVVIAEEEITPEA